MDSRAIFSAILCRHWLC